MNGIRLAAARSVVVAHPRHVVLLALVAGLLAGGWAPVVLVPLALVAAVVAGRGPVALLAVLATLAGGLAAQARVHAIEHGTLPAAVGADVRLDVTLLEPLRERASGRIVARVTPTHGRARGEPLLLRLRDASALRPAPVTRGSAAGPGGAAGSGAAAGSGGAAGRAVVRTALGPGDVLTVAGRLERLGPWDAYQRRRGALAGIEAVSARPTGARRGGVVGVLDGVRRRAEAALSRGLRPAQAALLQGMVLGRDDGIDRETIDAFRASGLAHLLAVSGSNVMLLCVLVLAVAGLVGVPLRLRLLVALGLVALYVPLTGAGPSIQRAGVMGACGLVAALAGRPASRWYAVCFAAAATLALNPLTAADPGWQLSFAAVLGLLALAPPLRAALDRRGWPAPVAEATALTLAATLATAPLLAGHFGQASLVSIPANLVVAVVVAPVMWLGTLAAAVGQVAPVVAAPIALCAAPLVGFVDWVARVAAQAPGATVALHLPGAIGIGAGYAVLGGVLVALRRAVPAGWSPPRGPAAALVLTALLALVALRPDRAIAPPRPGETVVSFLDVGQGDATVLQRDGAAVLVDTGTPAGDVVDRLHAIGVRRLDALVLTHAELDHEGNALAVLAALRPRLVVNGGAGWSSDVQRALPAATRAVGARIVRAVAGDDLAVGKIGLEVLWPPRQLADLPPEGSANDRALVLHASSGSLDVLLTADAEASVTASVRWPPVEVLKVAHHGSDDPGLPEQLRRLRPQVAAIEVGADNTYGHPTPHTLAALRAAVPNVFRTDRDGTVRLHASGAGGPLRVERLGPAS